MFILIHLNLTIIVIRRNIHYTKKVKGRYGVYFESDIFVKVKLYIMYILRNNISEIFTMSIT